VRRSKDHGFWLHRRWQQRLEDLAEAITTYWYTALIGKEYSRYLSE